MSLINSFSISIIQCVIFWTLLQFGRWYSLVLPRSLIVSIAQLRGRTAFTVRLNNSASEQLQNVPL